MTIKLLSYNCNRAAAAYAPPERASELYPNIQFASTTITDHPLNNFDINYTEGELITVAYNMTYDANGGTGSYTGSDIEPGGTDTVLSLNETGISRLGFTFTGWNTQPDGNGTSFAPGDIVTITGDVKLYAQWKQNLTPKPKRICRKPVTKCRTAIEGQKKWDDNDNIDGKRPDSVEILLLRDGEVYDRRIVNSENSWAFGFCCLPVWKNSNHKYEYQIDETDVPGYTKTIEGNNVINTLAP